MRKIILAAFVSLIAIPSIATLALADNPSGHDGHSTEGGGGGGNPTGHDGKDAPGAPEGGGNPDNHDLLRQAT